MREYTIGVDVGGTKTRVGLVDSNLRLINHQRDQAERLCFISCGMSTIGTKENGLITFATPTLKRYPDLPITTLQQMLVVYITQAVNELQKDVPSAIVRAGAMSFAGIVKENAVVTKAADLYFRWGTWGEVDTLLAKQPGKEFCLKKQLEKNMPSITWFIINDVVAAANRYCQLPRYQHLQTLGLLTISTGVGYILFNRSAGTLGDGDLVSLGHRIVDTSSEAAACDCGGKGHLAAYFSGKAVENKVRAGAVQDLHGFVHSSLCQLLQARFAGMSLEEKQERLNTAEVATWMQRHTALTKRDISAFVHKTHLSTSEIHTQSHSALLLALMTTNSEIVQALKNKDTFVLKYLREMMGKFALGFRDILQRRPDKMVIMGGFVLQIKEVFLDMLIEHVCNSPLEQETLRRCIDWAYDDDLDGVIGAVYAKQYCDEQVQGDVMRSIDMHGSIVFDMQARTQKGIALLQTRNVFAPQNTTLRNAIPRRSGRPPKVMVVFDEHVPPDVEQQIRHYFKVHAITAHLRRLTSAASYSMKDVDALLSAAKDFKLGRKDYFLTVGRRATLHVGGLAAAMYRRGISHIFLPLDSLEDILTEKNMVCAWEQRGTVSNDHLPEAIVFDERLNQHSCHLRSEVKTIQQIDQYKVLFVKHLFDPHNANLVSYVPEKQAFVVISQAVHGIYGERIKKYLEMNGIQYQSYVYAGGENNKYFPQVIDIVRQILMTSNTNAVLICIGGGVTMDLAGFAAALTQRPYIRIPTTLLGQIDAGIGVKVGCNYQGSKNFLGDFYTPLVCFNDVEFLKTVSPRHMRAGLAEILKMGIIREPKIVRIIEKHQTRLIAERLQTGSYARNLLDLATYWMLKELQPNLHENRTLQRLVDFGHTFSPYLEIKSEHQLLHGEAVAIDMAMCAQISYLQGHCNQETRDRIIHVLLAVGLPIFDDACDAEGLFHSLQDIRLTRGGSLHMPIPMQLGKMMFIEQVTYEELYHALAFLQSLQEELEYRPLSLPTVWQEERIAQQALA